MSDSDGAKLRMIRWQEGDENGPPIQQITFYGGEAIVEFRFGNYRELSRFVRDPLNPLSVELIGEERDTNNDRHRMVEYSNLMENMGK